MVERYGLTETLINTSVRARDGARPGTVGAALDGVSLRLVDDRRAPLEVDDDATLGEVAVRGPNVFAGYLHRPDATAAARDDAGWFYTGDLAARAPDGAVRIVGRRATDLIKTGGYKVGAGEVEAALLEHPAVREAAVKGVPDEDLGERIEAWVVLRPELPCAPGSLTDHVASLIAWHKRPRVGARGGVAAAQRDGQGGEVSTGVAVTSLSARTAWPRTPNALAEAVAARRAQGLGTLDLTASNPTEAFPRLPHDDVLEGLRDARLRAYRPEPQGLLEAREAVARYYAERGATVDPAQVVLTASTSEAYGWLFKLLCDPGDRVLVGRPGYPLFDDLARLEGVTLDAVPLRREARWGVDLDALDGAVGSRTRALSVVQPNNPTGHFVSVDDRAALLARCAEHGLALLVDEVFLDYGWGPPTSRARTFAGEVEALTFTLSGLSKVCAAPQVKLGWIVVSGPRAQRDEALARLELIADCYLSVSASAQLVAAELLARSAATRAVIGARVGANRAALQRTLRADSCVTLGPSEAGWYASARLPRTRSELDWALDLLRAGVLAQPGWFYEFDDEAWMVLSLLTPEDEFGQGVATLLRLAERG